MGLIDSEAHITDQSYAGGPIGDVYPIDFHCHGIGKFDFVSPHQLVLAEIERSLEAEGSSAVLTIYITRDNLPAFEGFCAEYYLGRQQGRFVRILGIATEGPLFSSSGGTPKAAKWIPTKAEWRRLQALGAFGLRYVVLSPDAPPGDPAEGCPADMNWIVEGLLEAGVKPALGHFAKDDPVASAAAVRSILRCAARVNDEPIVTDHLFNDMPLNFRHAWRTPQQRANRDTELAAMPKWRRESMREQLGEVPAAIIEGAWAGQVRICLNFDGAHVDLEICQRAVELVGSSHLMMMTDRIQSGVLGGQKLHRRHGDSLLYQADGIAAGGTCAAWQQVANMRRLGLTETVVAQIAHGTAAGVLGLQTASLVAKAS